MRRKERINIPERRRRRIFHRSFSRHGSGYRRRRLWLRAGREEAITCGVVITNRSGTEREWEGEPTDTDISPNSVTFSHALLRQHLMMSVVVLPRFLLADITRRGSCSSGAVFAHNRSGSFAICPPCVSVGPPQIFRASVSPKRISLVDWPVVVLYGPQQIY